MKNCLYSIFNCTRNVWATSTNFSTLEEAQVLLAKITKQCRGVYEIRERRFGTIKE